MNKEELRKCKWIVGHKYYLDGAEISENESEKIRWENEEFYRNKIEAKDIYEEGYFHRWLVKYCGNQCEGIYTDEFALVEKKNGIIIYKNPHDIIFIDEFEEKSFDNLKQLIGQSLQKNNFYELLKFIEILSKNELIQKYAEDIIKGFKSDSLNKILEIVDQLFESNGNDELIKEVIQKYQL